jgi:hypothetical protein
MMNKKLVLSASAATMILGLSGCQTAAYQALYDWDIRGNQASSQPTEGRVAPLVVPPDYALRPGQAGVPRTAAADGNTPEQVLEAMFGGQAQRSAGEAAITRAAGNSEMGIRSTVGDPDTQTVNKGLVTRDIIAAPEGDGQSAQAAVPQ